MKPNQRIVVRQSLFFNLFWAAIFLSIFTGVIFTIQGQARFDFFDYIIFIAGYCVPGLGAIYVGIRQSEVFRINEAGIFYCKKLITSWDRFIRGYVEEDGPEDGYNVKFSLHIEYFNTDTGIAEVITISLSPTLDKSTEEIQSAIESFIPNKI